MNKEPFLPHSITDLYEKMIEEEFTGQLSIEDDRLIWKLPNGITIKVAFHYVKSKQGGQFVEGYFETCYRNDKEEIPLTHWHPSHEEIYRDLYEINSGHTFWVLKKPLFRKNPLPLIMEKSEWQKYSEKRRNKYIKL